MISIHSGNGLIFVFRESWIKTNEIPTLTACSSECFVFVSVLLRRCLRLIDLTSWWGLSWLWKIKRIAFQELLRLQNVISLEYVTFSKDSQGWWPSKFYITISWKRIETFLKILNILNAFNNNNNKFLYVLDVKILYGNKSNETLTLLTLGNSQLMWLSS